MYVVAARALLSNGSRYAVVRVEYKYTRVEPPPHDLGENSPHIFSAISQSLNLQVRCQIGVVDPQRTETMHISPEQ